MAQYGAGAVNQTPTVGSIAWWDAASWNGGAGHVAYVEKVDGNKVYTTESSWGHGGRRLILTDGVSSYRSVPPDAYLHIRDAPAGTSPRGHFDSIGSPAPGQVRVTGWAYDPDKTSTAISVHVYVGGPSGSGEGHAITANTYRPDVNNAYPGAGDYHGFDATFNVGRRGTQSVYVYAINAAGTGGSNVSLGSRSVQVLPRDEEMIQVPGDTAVWWVHLGMRFHVPNPDAAACLGGFGVVKAVDAATRDKFPAKGDMPGCNGRMVRASGQDAVYLVMHGKRKWVPTADVAYCLGGWSAVHVDTAEVVNSFPLLDGKVGCDGRMIKVADNATVWYIHNGKRSAVANPDVVACMGGWPFVYQVPNAGIRDQFPDTGKQFYCAFRNSTPASVKGTPRAGRTLRAVPGEWSPTPAGIQYQWLLDRHVIKGATSRALTLKRAWIGKHVSVRIRLLPPSGYAAKTVNVRAGRIHG